MSVFTTERKHAQMCTMIASWQWECGRTLFFFLFLYVPLYFPELSLVRNNSNIHDEWIYKM